MTISVHHIRRSVSLIVIAVLFCSCSKSRVVLNISDDTAIMAYVYSYENGEEKIRYKFGDVGKILKKGKQKKITDYSIFKSLELMNEGFFVGFSGIYETSSFVLLNELTDYRYCILDKQTNKFRRYKYPISNDDECNHLPIISIKCTYGDWFVGIAQSMKLLQYKSVELTGDDKNLKELQSIIEGISFDSSPCLFFYKIASI